MLRGDTLLEGPACSALSPDPDASLSRSAGRGADYEVLGAAGAGGFTAGASSTMQAAQALQASAAAARASAAQQARSLLVGGQPKPQFGPGAGQPLAKEETFPAGKIATLNGGKPLARAAGTGNVARPAYANDRSAANDAGLDSQVQPHQRSWSIQEALDQHAALCQQKEQLTKNASGRLRARRTRMELARLEVHDAVLSATTISPADAACPRRTQAIALRVRRVSRDLALAQRLFTAEDTSARRLLRIAEVEVEKSRLEMKTMKQAIDDKSLVVPTDDGSTPPRNEHCDGFFYCANCKVGGHGQRFCEYLLKRPRWRVYPNQKWFEDEKHNEYHCPLGKRVVDFTDESHFSRLAMYLKGRIWLEDKTKLWEIVPDLMPDTYVIENRQWRDGHKPPADNELSNLPWFVKEADRNWGTSVQVCSKASQCMDLAKPDALYVVQQHIKDPLLMDDGRKCHIKFYVLLIGHPDGKTWSLYTCRDGYLSISPHAWSEEDLSKETQVTIIRSVPVQGWKHWPDAYPKCKAGVAEVIKRAVAKGKLEGRLGKTQFEILSSDFIVDREGNVWLFEFNMSPVLKDPADSPTVHDGDMITEALDLVVPWEGGAKDGGRCWDFAGAFRGTLPAPKAAGEAGSTETASPSDRPGGASEATPSSPGSKAKEDDKAAVAALRNLGEECVA